MFLCIPSGHRGDKSQVRTAMNGCVVSRSRVDSRRVPPTIPSIYYLYSLEQRMQILRAHFRRVASLSSTRIATSKNMLRRSSRESRLMLPSLIYCVAFSPSSSRWPSRTKEIIGRPVMRSLWPITSARRGERLYNISSC